MAGVFCLGIATLDHVFRIAAMPHAAEKFRALSHETVCGGCAATAAVAVARLGGRARLAARLGADATGDAIFATLGAEGVDCAACPRIDGAQSPISSVLVDPAGERMIVNYRGAGLTDDTAMLGPTAIADMGAALADTRWPGGAIQLMALAHAAGIPGIIDAEPPFDGLEDALALASHVAFSTEGLRTFTGLAGPEAGLRAARDRLSGWLCVTAGANGVWFMDGPSIAHRAAPRVEARDTLGAGDVWHGAFALALAERRPEAQAAGFANAAAALKCSGGSGWAAIPDRAAVAALLEEGHAA